MVYQHGKILLVNRNKMQEHVVIVNPCIESVVLQEHSEYLKQFHEARLVVSKYSMIRIQE